MWFFFFPSCYFTPLVNGWKTYSSAGTIIISFCQWLIAVHFRWMLITSKQSKTLHNNPALCRLVLLGMRCSYRDCIANAPSQQEICLSLYLLLPNCKIRPGGLAGEGALFAFQTSWYGQGLSASLSLSRLMHFPPLTAALAVTEGTWIQVKLTEDWAGSFILDVVN